MSWKRPTDHGGAENAGVDNAARDDKGGQGGSEQCGSGNTGQTLPTTSAEADTAVLTVDMLY